MCALVQRHHDAQRDKIGSAVDFIEQIAMHPVKENSLMEAMTSTSRKFYAGHDSAHEVFHEV
jgi:hypothetical protein